MCQNTCFEGVFEMDEQGEMDRLHRLPMTEVREIYGELHGESTTSNNKQWIIRRIIWRKQALAQGDLSERAKQRAAAIANDADLRITPPPVATQAITKPALHPVASKAHDPRLPPVGTILNRPYKGQQIQVRILTDGFECDGKVYSSLSSLAKEITGSHCNGFAFFKLTKGGKG
jgi:hypothetical protein